MAFTIMAQSGQAQTYLKEYIADSVADISNLPVNEKPGSVCLVASTGDVYILNNQKTWVKL